MREIRLLGSMKRDVETESWNLDCGTANRKGRQQLRGTYHHRATSRLYDELRGEKINSAHSGLDAGRLQMPLVSNGAEIDEAVKQRPVNFGITDIREASEPT